MDLKNSKPVLSRSLSEAATDPVLINSLAGLAHGLIDRVARKVARREVTKSISVAQQRKQRTAKKSSRKVRK